MRELVLWSTALLLLALLGGCVTDVANRYYVDERYEPRPPAEVQILTSKPTVPFVIIADFQSRGDTPKKLQEKAAKIGADAVLVTYVGGYHSRSEKWASDDRYKGKYHDHILGTAIVFTKERKE